MIRATIAIEGIRPLLMHQGPDPMTLIKTGGRKMRKQEPVQSLKEKIAEDAEKAAYRDSDGDLVIPRRNLLACIFGATKTAKAEGKLEGYTFMQRVKGSISLEPNFTKIMNGKKEVKNYAIDVERVKNKMGQTIAVIRARVDQWSAVFQITWDPDLYGLSSDNVHEVLTRAGNIGIGDWRPMYGAFRIVKFEVEKV